ncbi:ABC transporter permease [Metallibacterium sp.]|uniref:ABC transporter permease n=2 Tax=Metallibacterium sp. TaxID=2940281 RepID=UPI00261A0ECC|nr:ABC transporter permease [Metallibacterium sp.]
MNAGIVLRELLQSWRASLRKPGFVLLAGLTLALGLGLSVAMFALVNTLVLAPLPYPQARQLVVIGPADGAGHFSELPARWYPMLRDVPALQTTGYSVSWGTEVNVAAVGAPVMVTALSVSQHYLSTLGVRMALGRNFSAAETLVHGPRTVILTYGFWQSHYAGLHDVLGRTLMIDGGPATIVGVLPARFRMPEPFALMLPEALETAQRLNSNLVVLGRLKSGVSLSNASAQIDARLQSWLPAHGESLARHPHASATPLSSNMVAGYAEMLVFILQCNLALLALAGVNIANLMLQRTVAHGHSQAIRAALGASSLRTVLPIVGEAVLVSVLGTALGLAIAALCLSWANANVMRPEWFGFITHVSIQPMDVAGCAAASALVMFFAASVGLWRARSPHAVRELVTGGRGGQTIASGRLSKALVMLQATLATFLLIYSFLFALSEIIINRAPLGFSYDHVLTATIHPPRSQYADTSALEALGQRVLERLRAQPGIMAAGIMNGSPLASAVTLKFQRGTTPPFAAQYQFVTPDVFKALQIRLLAGRGFNAGDRAGAEPVAIVNTRFQKKYFAAGALNHRLDLILHHVGLLTEHLRIVGEVGDVHVWGPGNPPPPIVYVPMAQVPNGLMDVLRQYGNLHVMARTSGAPEIYRDDLKSVLGQVAPGLALLHLRPLAGRVNEVFAPNRMLTMIFGFIACVALSLSSLGLFAVVSTSAAARTREWGVRASLGASPARLLWVVLRIGLTQASIGIMAGLMLGWGVTTFSGGIQVNAISASVDTILANPLVLSSLVALLLSTAVLACLAPALRAARTPPVAALSDD